MNPNPKFCRHCGANLAQGAVFCSSCGQPVTPPATVKAPEPQPYQAPVPPTVIAPDPQSYPPPAMPPQQPYYPPPATPQAQPPYYQQAPAYSPPPMGGGGGGKKWWIWLIVGVVALVVIGGALLVVKVVRDAINEAKEITEIIPTAFEAVPSLIAELPEVTLEGITVPTIEIPTLGALPTMPSFATEAPPSSQRVGYDYDGVSFSFDPSLATTVMPETVPAETEFMPTPQHRRMTFLDYTLPDTFHDAQIMIYPMQEYINMDPSIGDRVATLQQMLNSRSTSNLPDPLPFFTNWNAGQVMATQVEFVDFQNGSGVRYLTQYGQAAYPINNDDMFYTFQGITSDNKWLISAVLPASNILLQGADSMTQDQAFYDNFANYVAETEALLDFQPPDAFTPNLTLLDDLIRTLLVR